MSELIVRNVIKKQVCAQITLMPGSMFCVVRKGCKRKYWVFKVRDPPNWRGGLDQKRL